jgi:hypothetical protein
MRTILSNGSRAAHMAADEGAVDGEGGSVASWLRPGDPPDDSSICGGAPLVSCVGGGAPPGGFCAADSHAGICRSASGHGAAASGQSWLGPLSTSS